MENARLRIKFQPLIHKKTINYPICCLEIVPVVSCIQNLDKLICKQSSNLIEYTIPMTYKLVLHKRPSYIQDSGQTSIKTYHSCVDLLLTSSNSLLECSGAADISKRISDTFIIKKCLEDCSSKENYIHCFTNECKYSENEMILPLYSERTKTVSKPKYIEKRDIETNTEDEKGMHAARFTNLHERLNTALFSKCYGPLCINNNKRFMAIY